MSMSTATSTQDVFATQHNDIIEGDCQPMTLENNLNNDCETCMEGVTNLTIEHSTGESERPAMGNDAAAAVGMSNQQDYFPMQLELHVEYKSWWTMPKFLSDDILAQWIGGAEFVSFIWDWKDTRVGSYRPEGAETSINRYIIDFSTMRQRNLDNNRTRRVKIVAVLRDDRHCAK